MNDLDIKYLLRQCKLILDCVDNSQMADQDAARISLLVNNIRTFIFCECEVYND